MLEQETVMSQIQDLLKKINMHTRQAMMKKFENEDITFHQLYILKTIDANPNINFKTLGDKLNLAKSSISLMINKLVDEGYVNRIENPDDRRNKLLILTHHGRIRICESIKMSRETFGTLLETISDDDLLNIKNNLQVLYAAMHEKMKVEGYGGCRNE